MAEWSLFARTADYALDGGLRLSQASMIRRHLGVDTAVVTTPYSPEAWGKLAPSNGLELWRNSRQEFTGRVTSRGFTRDSDGGVAIKVSCVGELQQLADRLAFPDPLRAADDQTVSDYWTCTATASTAMQQLISDQAGPTCRADRQIPGLVLGADPGIGVSRKWSALFPSVLDQLTLMSVASGANLGVRMRTAPGVVIADVVAPRNRAADIKFSADLSNLGSIDYSETAPTVTHALVAGQGDLRARLRKLATTSDPLASQWGRQVWSYIDRRDSADAAELLQAALDELAGGAPTVSLAVDLLDSQAAAYRTDYDVGDRVTAYVGLEGQSKVATVVDVIREIRLDVDDTGAETVRPAIGSYDAKASIPTPTQQALADVGRRLAALTRN